MNDFGLKRRGTYVVSLLMLMASAVHAGGLIDTSPERFAAAGFTDSGVITNPWWTLTAGSNFLYFAEDGDDCVWNLTEVTNQTVASFESIYAGTEARVVLDRGWVDEGCEFGDDFDAFIASGPETTEVTYDWYAQDGEQNIWYMGEHTFDGDFGGSFVAGCDGAEAGIVILGDPRKGDFYNQEFYEDEAEDWGKVLTFKRAADDVCMKTKEWTPLERGAIEHKFYCSDGDVGALTQIREVSGGKTVIVNLVASDVAAPLVTGLPISPVPSCP